MSTVCAKMNTECTKNKKNYRHNNKNDCIKESCT